MRLGDIDALLALYDQLAPTLFGYALAISRDRRQAISAFRQAFVDIWDAPVLISDPRVPPLLTVAALITHAVNRQPARRRPMGAAQPALAMP